MFADSSELGELNNMRVVRNIIAVFILFHVPANLWPVSLSQLSISRTVSLRVSMTLEPLHDVKFQCQEIGNLHA